MEIKLLVLRCRDLEASRCFYECLGFDFVQERHGDGPDHYASQSAGLVLELYPLAPGEPAGNTRLGFAVADPGRIISEVEVAVEGRREVGGETVYVIRDPDGRAVELSPSESGG